MKRVFLWLVLTFICGIFVGKFVFENKSIILEPSYTPTPRPLDKYTIDNLSKLEVKNCSIEIAETLSAQESYVSYLFILEFDPEISSNKVAKMTGQINIPKGRGPFPVIIMLRGYVDQEIYTTGTGTKRAGETFADAGYITVAPDFLGYGGSDSHADNIFESRFQSYVTPLALIEAIKQPSFAKAVEGKWDGQNIFIWAHSNGGQIALTFLATTQGSYPTTLWAPVTKPFPYNVLYYTDESQDRGKLIREELCKFEDLYDPNLYSFTNYLEKINAPLQIHQGYMDNAVPKEWSDEIFGKLKELNKDIKYYTYLQNDHNMQPEWMKVVEKDLEFFENHLK